MIPVMRYDIIRKPNMRKNNNEIKDILHINIENYYFCDEKLQLTFLY